MEWRLAEAKNKLSELVNLALTKGPQRILRRNDAVVMMSADDFNRLTGKQTDFKSYLSAGGADFSGIDLTRDKSPMRESSL